MAQISTPWRLSLRAQRLCTFGQYSLNLIQKSPGSLGRSERARFSCGSQPLPGNAKTGTPQCRLIRPGVGAATCELPIDRHGGHGFHTVLPGFCCDLGLVHVKHLDLARRAGNLLDEFYCFSARRAPSAKHFDLAFVGGHDHFSVALNRTSSLPEGAHRGHRRAAGCGQMFHKDELIRSPTPA